MTRGKTCLSNRAVPLLLCCSFVLGVGWIVSGRGERNKVSLISRRLEEKKTLEDTKPLNENEVLQKADVKPAKGDGAQPEGYESDIDRMKRIMKELDKPTSSSSQTAAQPDNSKQSDKPPAQSKAPEALASVSKQPRGSIAQSKAAEISPSNSKQTNGPPVSANHPEEAPFDSRILEQKYIQTNLGNVSFAVIERDVYNRLGFKTVQYSEPIATVRRVKPQMCETVFKEWLKIAATYNPHQKPVAEIPEDSYGNYTLYRHAYVTKLYFDERSENAAPRSWTESSINSYLRTDIKKIAGYAGEGEAVYHATNHYRLDNMTGVVIGSLSPWVEAYCLRNGAKKVITLEYTKIVSTHPQIGYYHPVEMAKNWTMFAGTFDFAASFSSIEHSGLGRFGDAMDPFGDLHELQKVRCLLRKNGLMFLAFPTGADGVYWNAHRVYGRIRLPLMFEGFKLLNTFYRNNTEPHNLTIEYFDFNARKGEQFVFVLQKVDD